MKRCWLWLFCLSWLSVVNAADYPGYQRLEPFQVQSADAQRSYQVQLLVPARAAPASGFPVLYLLDGHAALAALKAQWLTELEAGTPPLLVFIGHAGERPFNVPARTLDYTPARRDGQPMQAFNGVQGGGAAAFLALLEQRIKPVVKAVAAELTEAPPNWHQMVVYFVLSMDEEDVSVNLPAFASLRACAVC